jgi:hypothetical protein
MAKPLQFRDAVRNISPVWLGGGAARTGEGEWGEQGGKVHHAIMTGFDGLMEWAIQGLIARFPEECTPTALNALGRDRVIVRGFDESDESYRARLVRWLDDWRLAGHAFSILQQVAGYLTPHEVRLRIVTNSSVWYERDTEGTLTWSVASPANWDWDGQPTLWSRFWLILYPPDTLWVQHPPEWGDVDLWDGAWGSSGFTWGSTATPEQVATIRQIIRTWKPAHTLCNQIVIAFDEDLFDPTAAPGAPMPDGTWAPWGLVGSDPRTPSREEDASYWDGT